MTDRIFATSGDWAVASDGVQWILMRRWKDGKWRGVSFVRSTKDILARCTREKGTDEDTARLLLAGLPSTVDEWKSLQASSERHSEAFLADALPAAG